LQREKREKQTEEEALMVKLLMKIDEKGINWLLVGSSSHKTDLRFLLLVVLFTDGIVYQKAKHF
jgi:hypothetical protein